MNRRQHLTTKTEKKREKHIPLSKAKRKATGSYYTPDGSYYTPDPIVEYIVEHTVGPVFVEKLEALRPRLRKVRKTFDRELEKARVYPVKKPSGETWEPRQFALEKVYTEHKELFEDLLYRIIYRMGGITGDEVRGLEERLARMLW